MPEKDKYTMSTPDFQREVLMSLAKTEDKLELMQKQLDLVNLSIMGNEKAGIKGLAGRTKVNEDYIEGDKKLKWIGAGIMMVLGFVGGYAKEIWHSMIK